LFAARWPMVLGFALLALHLGLPLKTPADAESVLTRVIGSDLFPPGARGLMIAALLAAAMSTFDSTVNAGASYLVRDIYQPLRAKTSERELVHAGYAASGLLVGGGLFLALGTSGSVLDIWTSIVMQLFPAFLVPFALRWFWARFNGVGFTCGVAGGFAGAIYFWLVRPPGWTEATQFLAIIFVSLSVALGATWATAPVPERVLQRFYQKVSPFGIWPRAWRAPDRSEHRADASRLALTLLWQVLTFLLPMGILLRMWESIALTFPVWMLLGWRLWRKSPLERRMAVDLSADRGNIHG
jgi:Na+/proline symporter